MEGGWKMVQQGEMLLSIPLPSMYEGGIRKISVQVHPDNFAVVVMFLLLLTRPALLEERKVAGVAGAWGFCG
jgi:hypothetical protein